MCSIYRGSRWLEEPINADSKVVSVEPNVAPLKLICSWEYEQTATNDNSKDKSNLFIFIWINVWQSYKKYKYEHLPNIQNLVHTIFLLVQHRFNKCCGETCFCLIPPRNTAKPSVFIRKKDGNRCDYRPSYPLRGSIALLQAQSCAHLVYTLPTSLRGRRIHGSRPRRIQKSEKLLFLASVPPQVVPEVAQSAYNRDFRPLHVLWCVKNVLVRTPREIHGFPGTNIVIFSTIWQLTWSFLFL